MAIDLSFDDLALAVFTLNGRSIELNRFKTPSRKTLTHRTWIKSIQRRYSRSWRFIKGVKELSRSRKGVRNISWDIGDLVADLAFNYNPAIILGQAEG